MTSTPISFLGPSNKRLFPEPQPATLGSQVVRIGRGRSAHLPCNRGRGSKEKRRSWGCHRPRTSVTFLPPGRALPQSACAWVS